MIRLPALPQSLTAVIPTAEEAAQIVDALDETLQGKFKTKINPFEEMKRVLPYPVMHALVQLYQKTEGSMEDTAQLYSFLEEVKQTLSALPILSLELAITPTQKVLETISSWVEKNLEKPHLLQIVVKHELLAGAAIGYQGRIKDYSLMKRLPEVLGN